MNTLADFASLNNKKNLPTQFNYGTENRIKNQRYGLNSRYAKNKNQPKYMHLYKFNSSGKYYQPRRKRLKNTL
ncbi:hypothetical protein [Pantoea agglomerans]|uniref:hypothetical protein n=1 Tax=Enterobacter agglomerans TaxID=549 RepID=UPI003C7ABD26